jgi:hypothetical protein
MTPIGDKTGTIIIAQLSVNEIFNALDTATKLQYLNTAQQTLANLCNTALKSDYAITTLGAGAILPFQDAKILLHHNGAYTEYTTIPAAITAAVSGDTIELTAFRFELTDTLDLKNGVNIVGKGKNGTIISFASDSAGETVGDNNVAVDCALENLKIVRDGVATVPNNGIGLFIDNPSSVIRCKNVRVESSENHGIANHGTIYGIEGYTSYYHIASITTLAGIYNDGKLFDSNGYSDSNIGICNDVNGLARNCKAYTFPTANELVSNGWVAFMNYGEAQDCSGYSTADDGFVNWVSTAKSQNCHGISHRTFGFYNNGLAENCSGMAFGDHRRLNALHYPTQTGKTITTVTVIGSGLTQTFEIASASHGIATEYIGMTGVTGITGGDPNTVYRIASSTAHTITVLTGGGFGGAGVGGILDGCTIPMGVIQGAVATAVSINVNGYSLTDIGFICNAGAMVNCAGWSDANDGINVRAAGPSNLVGCKGVSSTLMLEGATGYWGIRAYNAILSSCSGRGLLNSNGMFIVDCEASTCSGYGLRGVSIETSVVENCTFRSFGAENNTISTSVRSQGCFYSSALAQAIYVVGNGVKLIGSNIECTWNNAAGHGIIVAAAVTGLAINTATIRVTHASAKAIETEKLSAHSIAYAGVISNYPVGTNVSQTVTGVVDAQSNIYDAVL